VEICKIVGGMVGDRIGRFKVDLMEGEGFELVGWERRKRGKRGKRGGVVVGRWDMVWIWMLRLVSMNNFLASS